MLSENSRVRRQESRKARCTVQSKGLEPDPGRVNEGDKWVRTDRHSSNEGLLGVSRDRSFVFRPPGPE